jgi:hypothetical protein
MFTCLLVHCLANDYSFCFYDQDQSLCQGQTSFSISDCGGFVNYSVTDPRYVNLNFTASLPNDTYCVIDLTRFANATTVTLRSIARRFSAPLSAALIPPDISLTNMIVWANFSQTDYTNLTLTNSTILPQSTRLGARRLAADMASLVSFTSVSAAVFLFNLTAVPAGLNTVTVINHNSVTFYGSLFYTVELNVIRSSILVTDGATSNGFFIDFAQSGGSGTIIVDNSAALVLTLRCLGHSALLPIPRLHVLFRGLLMLPASNWPLDRPSLLALEQVGVAEIVIGGYVPADMNGTGDLIIQPESEETKLIGSLSIGSNSLAIIALTWTTLIHFCIRRLDATGPRATISGWPPYLNVTIESFSNIQPGVVYNFTGTGFFSFAELPEPLAVVAVDTLWIGYPVRVPFTLDNASRFAVQGKVKMANGRSTFLPTLSDSVPSDEEINRHKSQRLELISGELLKCDRERLDWPPFGPRGFARGVTVYDGFCRRSADTTCFGM